MNKSQEQQLHPNRERLIDMGLTEAVVFDSPAFDDAIIGTSSNDRVIYDYNKMVECLMQADNLSAEEAIEFIDYNTVRALDYQSNGPIILYPFD